MNTISTPDQTDAQGASPTAVPGGETPPATSPAPAPVEIGGRGGLDPTRYGDWEKNGRCIDF